MNKENMAVLTNVIGAVESGGQIYGKRDYSAYAAPYTNSNVEHTITLGWAQNYGSEAHKLIQMIYDADPAAFKKIDGNGSIKKALAKDWVATRWNPSAAQKKTLIALISSNAGKKCQDELFAQLMNTFIAECEKKYTKDVRAIMMYCEIRHLGGDGPVKRIFDRLGGDYSLDAIMASLKKDQNDTSNSNQVGDAKFWTRHQKCRQFIEKYAVVDTVDKVDESEDKTVGVTAEQIIAVYRSWIGLSRAAGTHSVILDLYNKYIREHPGAGRNYQVQRNDAYCDTTLSAAFIKAGAVDLIGGVECGVEEHVKIFKRAGIWEENGSVTPKPGWPIIYNWDDATQPNDGYSDHIGIVEKVSGGYITCIEGNMNGGVVGRRTIPVGWGYIRGYAKPKYAASSGKTEQTQNDTATQQQTGGGTTLSKAKKWNGIVVDKTGANVRTWPGTENHQVSFSPLKYGSVVDVCDTIKAADQTDWYYIRYNGRYGFVSAALIQRKETAAAAPFTPADQTTKKTATYGASIGPDKSVAGTYKVTADSLNIRNRAGVDTAKGCTILGAIPEGTKVKNYGFYSIVGGEKWLYIQVTYDGVTYTGHCSGEYLKKV